MGAFISWIKKHQPPPDQNQGSSRGATSSLSGMISTLVPILVITAVYLALFFFFRRSQRRFYAPRSYLGSLRPNQKSPQLPNGWFNWFGPFWKLPDAYALQHQSLDAYLFIRYLKVAATISFVSLCITWPILFPVNATGGKGLSELERVGYSNVDIDKKPNYLYAHVFVGWAVYLFVMYTITRECIFYINLRQTFLLSPFYGNRLSSRVVLFTNVPADYLDEGRLRAMYPGVVRRVWIAGDTKELDELVDERDKTALKLEGAEVKLIKLVNKTRNKALKKGGEDATRAPEADADTETGNVVSRWIPDKKRPSHRLGFLGLFGKKVDTIEWGRDELHKGIPKAEAAQAEYVAGNFKKIGAVFIEFETQADAEAAYQTVTHHTPLHMCPKVIGVRPDEVVWSNLSIPWWQKVIRRYAVLGFITALIVFWAIPVGIVGIISQVKTLENLPGLGWIKDIPSVILGVVSGLLPSVALAILMSLVPIIMRWCGKLSGLSTLSQIELFTQNAYFCFQVIQVFLVATITSSASTAIIQIAQKPDQVFSLLSEALPTSANLYISYFMVQGITIATGVLTQVVGMVIFRILYKFLAGTPRALYTKWTTLAGILWGSLLPVITNLVVILITYSVIQPIVLFWSTIGLFLFYLAYRYNLLFVADTAVDTRGLIYPRALKQLFVGIYLGEICMVGLFAVSKAIGPAVLMAVFLIFTILFQITLFKNLNPLLYGLSRSLAAEERLLQERDGHRAAIAGDAEKNGHHGADGANNGASANNGADAANGTKADVAAAKAKSGNIFLRWLKPWQYADYHTLRELVPEHAGDNVGQLDADAEAKAYWPPSATTPTPTLWIPEDAAGVSKQEVALTGKVIGITDQGASLNEKNTIVWDEENARPPIYTEKPEY